MFGVRPLGQQHAGKLGIALVHGGDQRSLAGLVGDIDVGPGLDQRLGTRASLPGSGFAAGAGNGCIGFH